jgi:hypothetical protein
VAASCSCVSFWLLRVSRTNLPKCSTLLINHPERVGFETLTCGNQGGFWLLIRAIIQPYRSCASNESFYPLIDASNCPAIPDHLSLMACAFSSEKLLQGRYLIPYQIIPDTHYFYRNQPHRNPKAISLEFCNIMSYICNRRMSYFC